MEAHTVAGDDDPVPIGQRPASQLTGARSWRRAASEGWLADMLAASLLSR